MFSIVKDYLFFESVPEHPDTIVISNQYYPRGLTEQDIYSYYMTNKDKILREVYNREVMLFIVIDKDNIIVKRHLGRSGGFIKLNEDNYDNIISGRTISIHSTFKSKENFGIIDIDYHDFESCKESTARIYKLLYKQNKNIEIKYTGKNSFHILFYFNNWYPINDIRIKLFNILQELIGDNSEFTINKRRSNDKINLDLSSNKFRGGFISYHSLSVLGLRCMRVPVGALSTFEPTQALIKKV